VVRFFYFRLSMQYPNKNISIKQWAEDDRPREKMVLKGRAALSDAELLAILIANGNKENSALDLAKQVLNLTQNKLNELGKLSHKDFQKIKGIGAAKAITIMAALELGRRRKDEAQQAQIFIKSSKDIYHYLAPYLSDLPHEEFWIILLNRANKIIAHKKLSEGGVTGTVVDLRILFKHAIEHLACSVVLCHNHPSGNINPSEQDKVLTKKIYESGKLMEVQLLDHVIFTDKDYYSFADNDAL
jgi:DNA repair protein RadC